MTRSGHTHGRITAKQRRRSINMAIFNSIFSITAGTCLGSAVFNLAAIKLGATEIILGMLNFLISGIWIFNVFTMSAVERIGKRKVLFPWKIVSAIFAIPFFLLPVVADKWSASASLTLLAVSILLRGTSSALGDTGWLPILHDIVPQQITGRFFARLRITWQTTNLITFFYLAWLLGKNPTWWNFQIIFIIGFIAAVINIISILPISEGPLPKSPPKKISIFTRFRNVFSQHELRPLVFYITTYTIAAFLAEPFKIKLLKDLGYSEGFILAATAMTSLGAISSLAVWGKMSDKFGNSPVFLISNIGAAVFTFLWFFVSKGTYSVVFIFALFFFFSVFHCGNGIAQTRCTMLIIPKTKQYQLNILNIFTNVSAGIAPLLGGLFLKLTENCTFNLSSVTIDHYKLLFILACALFILPYLLNKNLISAKDSSAHHTIKHFLGSAARIFR